MRRRESRTDISRTAIASIRPTSPPKRDVRSFILTGRKFGAPTTTKMRTPMLLKLRHDLRDGLLKHGSDNQESEDFDASLSRSPLARAGVLPLAP